MNYFQYRYVWVLQKHHFSSTSLICQFPIQNQPLFQVLKDQLFTVTHPHAAQKQSPNSGVHLFNIFGHNRHINISLFTCHGELYPCIKNEA